MAEVLGARAPGPEEIFGAQVSLEDLRDRIGRDEDTNTGYAAVARSRGAALATLDRELLRAGLGRRPSELAGDLPRP